MGNILRPLWEECPAVTRLLLVTYPTLSLVLTLMEAAGGVPVHRLFACSARAVFWDLRIWTPFLSVFYRPFVGGMGFLMTLLELYMGMVHFPQRERELGSAAFAVWALLANAAANSIYLLIMLALSTLNAGYLYAPNMGMFELIMVLMSSQVLANPGGSSNFWGLIAIPNKWYPLALVGIFSLLNMAIMWNMLAAVAVGYVALKYPPGIDRLLPPQATIKRIDGACCSNRRALLGGWWVPAGGLSLPGAYSGASPAPSLFGSSDAGRAQELQPAGRPAKFTAFSGPGRRLGDGSEDAGPKPGAAAAAAMERARAGAGSPPAAPPPAGSGGGREAAQPAAETA